MDNKYKYSYEGNSTYCYKGTDILINLLNITNHKDLYELKHISLKTYELNEKPLKDEFDLK